MAPQDTCKACGGFEFSLSDGFMYCDRCGTLLENFEELEEEEGGLQQNLGAGRVKIKKPGDAADRKKRAGPRVYDHFASNEDRMAKSMEKRNEFLRKQMDRKEILPHENTPDYLYSVGQRLAVFTRILTKSTYILTNEMGFDTSVSENGLAVFQKYLAHCQVAFCASEQCGADEELRFVAVMENLRYEQEEREAKRRKKLARRGKGITKLSKSAAAWQLLTQGNLTENLDVETDEDEEEEEPGEAEPTMMMEETNVADETMGFIRKITTALSKDAVDRAAKMILNLEILVAILHSTLLCSGHQNVMVSDLIRWIREDRFRLAPRMLRLLRQGVCEKNMSTDQGDRMLKYPLYEIQRTCALFQQSVQLTLYQAPPSFELLAARLIDNLNLPSDMLSRVLLLESIVACDVAPSLKKQATVRIGHRLTDLALLGTFHMSNPFMECFSRKEAAFVKGIYDEVLFSPETKILAYILLALRLTFDIDHEHPEAPSDDDDSEHQHFTIDTWIHQLEMRIKCWQGHDMSMVLRESCPIPPISKSLPFGDEYIIRSSAPIPFVARYRRHYGFRDCIPPEMCLHANAQLPTVFDIRENRHRTERQRPEAVLSPLKFQTVALHREIDMDTDKYRFVDEKSHKTFLRDFRNYQSTDVAESFDEFFPYSRCYESYARPDLISNCSARTSRNAQPTGPYHFFLSNQGAEDLLNVARPSFSDRFRFLLRSLALTIGEHEYAVYSAYVMLEILLLGGDELTELRQNLVAGNPIPINGVVYKGSMCHRKMKFGIVSSMPIENLDELREFSLTCRFFDHPDLATDSEDVAFLKFSRNVLLRDAAIDRESQESENSEEVKTANRMRRISHNFEKFFSILAVKFW